MPTLEQLQQAEQWWHHILDLFTQTDQALEQVRALVEQAAAHDEYGQHSTEHHPVLMESIADVQRNLHNATDVHNRLLAEIQAAQQTAQQQANALPENPY